MSVTLPRRQVHLPSQSLSLSQPFQSNSYSYEVIEICGKAGGKSGSKSGSKSGGKSGSKSGSKAGKSGFDYRRKLCDCGKGGGPCIFDDDDFVPNYEDDDYYSSKSSSSSKSSVRAPTYAMAPTKSPFVVASIDPPSFTETNPSTDATSEPTSSPTEYFESNSNGSLDVTAAPTSSPTEYYESRSNGSLDVTGSPTSSPTISDEDSGSNKNMDRDYYGNVDVGVIGGGMLPPPPGDDVDAPGLNAVAEVPSNDSNQGESGIGGR